MKWGRITWSNALDAYDDHAGAESVPRPDRPQLWATVIVEVQRKSKSELRSMLKAELFAETYGSGITMREAMEIYSDAKRREAVP